MNYLTNNQRWARLKYIALFCNMHSVRFTLAMAETIWFISLIWPGNTFDRPTYSLMGNIASEPTWALVFLATACCQWWVLLSNLYHTKLVIAFAAWNSTLWWLINITMYLSVYPPPAAISGELALAFAASWVFIRAGVVNRHGRRIDDR